MQARPTNPETPVPGTGAKGTGRKRPLTTTNCARTLAALLLLTTIAGVTTPALALAGSPEGVSYKFDITGISLPQALRNYAQVSGQQIIFTESLLQGAKPVSLQGNYTAEDALNKLLKDTGLTYERAPNGMIMIRRTGDTKTTFLNTFSTREEREGAQPGKGEDCEPGMGDSSQSAKQSDSSSSGNRGHSFSGSGGKTAASNCKNQLRLSENESDTSNTSETRNQTSGNEQVKVDCNPPAYRNDPTCRQGIQEIVVTATKRGESAVQDIPLSIAVIGNQDIERRGLIGMEDYLRSIPSVNQIDQGPLSNSIVIRGITTAPEFEGYGGGGGTVSRYFGESPIGNSTDIRPVDIERIEVLRGPQGTAYGAASLGGTMRMIPASPTLDGFDATVVASYSGTSGAGDDNSMLQGIVNLPLLTDKLALRAVGYRYEDSGFYRNVAGNDPATIAKWEAAGLGDFVRGHVQDDVGKMVSTGGRLSALWQATDNLSLSLGYLTQTIEQDGQPATTVDLGKFEQSRLPVAPQARIRGKEGEVVDGEMDLLSLVLNYELGWASLTSTGSWIDNSGATAITYIDNPFVPTITSDGDGQSSSAEVRLASKLNGSFQFLGGVFYEESDSGASSAILWPDPSVPNPLGTASPVFYLSEGDDQFDQRAVFGELSYDLTEKVTATVGGRYFEYNKDNRLLEAGPFTDFPLGEGITRQFKSTEDGNNFKVNLSYEPTQDSLFYASWAEGFRLGRPDPGLPSTVCDNNPADGMVDGTDVSMESTRTVNSDFLDQSEIGAKLALFDRRMTVDAAVYRIDWDGLPVLVRAPCTLLYTANAGTAKSTGAEFQASLFVTKSLRLDFGGSYTDAKLTKNAPGIGAEKGAQLPGSPKVSANLAAQYEFDLAGHRAFVRTDSFYAGEFEGDLLATESFKGGDYIKLDARAGVMFSNFSVDLFVRNLTNEDAFTWRSPQIRSSYRMRPRTVGIQVGYRFGE